MAQQPGDLHIDLGRRHYIDRAMTRGGRLAKPLSQLATRGLLPRPGMAQQPVFVRIYTPQGTARGIAPSYLSHDGKGRDGHEAPLYGPGSQDPRQFTQRHQQDQHRFAIILSFPEHGGVDRTGFVTQYLRRMEKDLGTSLDWLAANHYDTEHPHTHIVVRGVTDTEEPLYMRKSYFTHGIRERAAELLTQLTGRVPAQRVAQEQQRTLETERSLARSMAQLDGRILGGSDPDVGLMQRQCRQQLYGHEGLAAHVDRLWAHVQEQELHRQLDQARTWGRGY